MPSSYSPSLDRALDTMLIVYSLLRGHPACLACEQFIRGHTGWFTSTLHILEAKAVLTRVYSVDPALATQDLARFAASSLIILGLEEVAAVSALAMADTLRLDLPDAVLVHLTTRHGAAYLATEDQNLVRVCQSLGISALSPVDPVLRGSIAAWETANLVPKGLPRVLARIHNWLGQSHPHVAQAFWSQTGAGSHLP